MPFDKIQLKTSSEDGHNVVLAESLDYLSRSGELIKVPSGASSDGASTPRILWRIFPPFGKYWRAALLHDYLYRSTDRPKSICDKLFYEAMLSCGVAVWKATVIYAGVKFCGRIAFNNCRKPKEVVQ